MASNSKPRITNFAEAFEYVNSKYVYGHRNYPVMSNLDLANRKTFALKHGLLHILKSVYKMDMDIPFEKKSIRKLQWVAQPDEKLSSNAIESKTALLKIIVNILSISKTAEMTEEEIVNLDMPTEHEMIMMIPIKQMANQIVPTFQDSLQYFIEKMASILEKADHENTIDGVSVHNLVESLFKSMIYWFDDFWVPDFLDQIPNVMKSK